MESIILIVSTITIFAAAASCALAVWAFWLARRARRMAAHAANLADMALLLENSRDDIGTFIARPSRNERQNGISRH